MNAMKVAVETITPVKAEQWINANRNNRSLRGGVVEQYAHDMKVGQWTQCTAPICFYDDGDLADGQHRLYAIMESGTTQTFTVMRGLARRDGLNIDTNLPRSLVDSGRISGLDTGLSIAIISTSRAIASGMPAAGRMSNADKLKLVDEHREAAQWAVSKLPHTKNVCNSAALAAIARAWYVEPDHDRLEKFCKVLGTGFSDGDADSAAVSIRNYMLAHAGVASGTAMWRDTFLKVQNAIQYFMQRKRLTVVKGVKDETYPLTRKAKRPALRRAA